MEDESEAPDVDYSPCVPPGHRGPSSRAASRGTHSLLCILLPEQPAPILALCDRPSDAGQKSGVGGVMGPGARASADG